jgi:hypothetical protein
MRAEVTDEEMTEDTRDEHGTDEHGQDDHAHGAEELGPIDVQAWGAFVVGIAAGLVIVLCLVLSTSVVG